MSIPQFIGNQVGKERNTMHIINWFIQKIKNTVKAYRDNRSRKQIEKWYSANEVTDEQLRLDHEQMMADYQQQCKEEDERIAKEEKELEAQILEDKRTEKIVEEEYQILQQMKDDIIWKREQCPSCGYSSWECTCYLDEQDDKPEIPQMGLPGHEEEEIPLWLEHANEECPNCGLLPEFCQCQYEE